MYILWKVHITPFQFLIELYNSTSFTISSPFFPLNSFLSAFISKTHPVDSPFDPPTSAHKVATAQ
jgi:hypothetical protein